jgi:hypothetical protein
MNIMANLPDRFCLQCNAKFKPYRPLKHKFCSGKCRLNYYLESKNKANKAALTTEIEGVFEDRIKALEKELEEAKKVKESKSTTRSVSKKLGARAKDAQ